MSPSNRQRLVSAGLYDTAGDVIENAARDLTKELYDKILKKTSGRWLAMVHGHHYFDLADGTTTDSLLADLLGTTYVGTSAIVRIQYGKGQEANIYMHHGNGGGGTQGASLNTLDRLAHGWNCDVFVMGHTTKTPATRFARVSPKWDDSGKNKHELVHKEVLLVNSGGFCKSSIVGSKHGNLPHGDYAEAGLMTPSPLSAPLIYLKADGQIRVEL